MPRLFYAILRHSTLVASITKPRNIMEGNGRQWKVMESYGISWKILIYNTNAPYGRTNNYIKVDDNAP